MLDAVLRVVVSVVLAFACAAKVLDLASFRAQLTTRMGDPATEQGRTILHERTPLTYADKIVKPLLIGQGQNDPRVNVAESEQIVKAMQSKNIPVTYVLFPDEGHGFRRPENNTAFNAVTEDFLANKCLGGRFQPIGSDLRARGRRSGPGSGRSARGEKVNPAERVCGAAPAA